VTCGESGAAIVKERFPMTGVVVLPTVSYIVYIVIAPVNNGS
jgi:hypothetical protein